MSSTLQALTLKEVLFIEVYKFLHSHNKHLLCVSGIEYKYLYLKLCVFEIATCSASYILGKALPLHTVLSCPSSSSPGYGVHLTNPLGTSAVAQVLHLMLGSPVCDTCLEMSVAEYCTSHPVQPSTSPPLA